MKLIFFNLAEGFIIATRDYRNEQPKFVTTDTKLYVSVATDKKLLRQLKTSFKRTIFGINVNQNQHYR